MCSISCNWNFKTNLCKQLAPTKAELLGFVDVLPVDKGSLSNQCSACLIMFVNICVMD